MKTPDYKIPALILGSHTTALGTMRSLAAEKIKTFCITRPNRYITFSRHYHRPPFGYPFLSDPEQLEAYLAGFPLQRAVLFPCSDDWVLAVSRKADDLSQRFPVTISEYSCLRRLIDKGNLRALLEQHGIPHPPSFVIDSAHDLDRIDEQSESVWFLKPVDSLAFRSHYHVKAFIVKSAAEAHRRYDDAKRAGFEMILQEYIPGPAGSHYFIDGYIDAGGSLRSLFVRRRLRMHPPDFGDSSYMVSIPKDEAGDAAASVTALLSDIGYRGIFSVEFKKDHRDNSFRLVEVNTRAWAYIAFAAACGVNIAHQAYRDALGLPVPEITEYTIGKRMVFLINDIPAGIRHVKAKKTTPLRCLAAWLGSHKATYSWDDPAPGLANIVENAFPKLRHLFTRKG